MRPYLLRRLILFIPTAFGVSVFIFVMLHTIPGDYATALLLGNREDQITATPEDFERVREQLGLDGSLPPVRPLAGQLLPGDFGTSWSNRIPVIERMAPRIVLSFELGLLSVLLACVLGITAGVVAAVRRDT
jgi:peptide/nickel transport system permease protein